MREAEIEFCKRWIELRGPDGCVLWERGRDTPFGSIVTTIDWYDIELSVKGESFFVLTRHGLDLVASYEHALAQGLPIVPDDAFDLDAEVDALSRDLDARNKAPCPDCKDGTIGVPIEYGASGGILRVWPATCPTCKGARVVDGAPEVAPTRAPDEGWRPLTRNLATEWSGRLVDVRRVTDPCEFYAHRLGAISDRRFVDILLDGKKVTGIPFESISKPNPDKGVGWEVRPSEGQGAVSDGWTTEPMDMRELLRECAEDRALIDLRWSDMRDPGSASSLGFEPRRVAWVLDDECWIAGTVDGKSQEWSMLMRGVTGDQRPVITAARRRPV